MTALNLPRVLRAYCNRRIKEAFNPVGMNIDFAGPKGEEALFSPNSVAWRVYKNPVTMLIGGVSSVYMQLGDSRIRSGVRDYSSFRENAVQRVRRTGLAAMMTVYGPKSSAERMIDHVNKMHEKVNGITPEGVFYRAQDPTLLNWVW